MMTVAEEDPPATTSTPAGEGTAIAAVSSSEPQECQCPL